MDDGLKKNNLYCLLEKMLDLNYEGKDLHEAAKTAYM
jgi:hypothetical protein